MYIPKFPISTNPKILPALPGDSYILSRSNCGTSRLRFESKRSSWREDWITTSECDEKLLRVRCSAQLLLLVPGIDDFRLGTQFGSKFLRITSLLLCASEKRRGTAGGGRFESWISSTSLENEISWQRMEETSETDGTELKIESCAGRKSVLFCCETVVVDLRLLFIVSTVSSFPSLLLVSFRFSAREC